jgi:hypothetical protein
MRNLLALLGLLLVLFAGLGWYMGWYKIKTGPNVSIDIDQKKVRQDVPHLLHEGKEKVQQWLESGKDGAGAPAKAGQDPAEKSSAVRAAPDVSGFPFDSPAAKAPTSNLPAPILGPTSADAPIPGAYYKPGGPSTPPILSVPSGSSQGD